MTTISKYRPENGVTAYAAEEYQLLTTTATIFEFASETISVPTSGKFGADNCWETGQIWQIQGSSLVKRTFDGEELYSVVLSSPSSVSVIQPNSTLPSNVNDFAVDDFGAWVTDRTNKTVTRYSSSLEESVTITNLSDPVICISDLDGGCYFFDDGLSKIYKVNGDNAITGFIGYSSVYSGFSDSSDIVNVKIDLDGLIWICFKAWIVGLSQSEGLFSVKYEINPYVSLMNGAEGQLNDMDLDRGIYPNRIYLICGCPGESRVGVYDTKTKFISKQSNSLKYQSAIRVSQLAGSELFYVMEETDDTYIPDICNSSSSSSSSSSTSSLEHSSSSSMSESSPSSSSKSTSSSYSTESVSQSSMSS